MAKSKKLGRKSSKLARDIEITCHRGELENLLICVPEGIVGQTFALPVGCGLESVTISSTECGRATA